MTWFIRGFACFAILAAGLLVAPGCNKTPDKGSDPKKKDTAAKKDDGGKGKEHDHPEKGPHGGPLAEWGEEKYHAEFTVDHDKKEATVYILDGSAKKASPIAAESIMLTITSFKPSVKITLKSAPDKGDPKGSSSRFVGAHDKLAEKVEYQGEISGKVGDTPYVGKFEEKDDHEKKKDKK
jgi:hypothetical protein